MVLLLATTNTGKMAEVARILGEEGLEVRGLEGRHTTQEIETGSTYAENALLKAGYYHESTGLPTIADDSGLEVDALGGEPGVRSARYAAEDRSSPIERLLARLEGVPAAERRARFVCAAAVVWSGGSRVFTGEVRGAIAAGPAGQGGFGYDPIFYHEPSGLTFAELSDEEKARVSHRALAFRLLARWVKGSSELDSAEAGDKIRVLDCSTSVSTKPGGL